METIRKLREQGLLENPLIFATNLPPKDYLSQKSSTEAEKSFINNLFSIKT